jgi:glycosyltransferase involved in cell wall biosynthesis|tara:strand:+ start:596 stop:1555 length:960 start_codon:yes stop_codon:yes gene_type:complete
MKTVFLHDGPHHAHGVWAKSLNAKFISNITPGFPIIYRIFKIPKVIAQIPSDTELLLCESGAAMIAGAMWKKRNPKGKFIQIIDDPKITQLDKMDPITRKIYVWALSQCDLLIPTTPLMKSYIPKKYQGKIKIVPLFVDYKKFHQKKANIESKNIIFVGRVGKEKGVDRIVSIFKGLNQTYGESRLYIIGDGPLKSILKKSSENIIWAGFQKNPREYLIKGSIYLNMARIEPAGVAVLEAMATGLVPVVTDKVGFHYAVRDVAEELIVKDGQEAERVIKRLWSSPSLLREYSNRAMDIAEDFTEKRSLIMFKEAVEWII